MPDDSLAAPPAPDAANRADPADSDSSLTRESLHLLVSHPDAPERPALHRWAVGLFVTYLAALALIAFWPTPVDRDAHGYLLALIDLLQRHGAPGWVRYNVIEFLANILLFVPVGLFVVVLAGDRRWWLGPLAGFGGSCAIELGQLVFLPARYATINDVIANSTGALFGTALALFILLLHHQRSRPVAER